MGSSSVTREPQSNHKMQLLSKSLESPYAISTVAGDSGSIVFLMTQKETGVQVIQGKEQKGFGGLAWESDTADSCRQPRRARDEEVVPGEAGLEQRRQEARPESLDFAPAVAGIVCCGHHSGSGAYIFLILLLRVFQEGWSC